MKISVIIPAYNEELTIAAVVRDFAEALPEAEICVIDNNSKDRTAACAKAAMAEVGIDRCRFLRQPIQGKANAVKLAFREIDADIYLMVDADSTYLAADARQLIDPVASGEADMAVGDRISGGEYGKTRTRAFHTFGNDVVVRAIRFCFKARINDVMSGYRAMSRRLVANLPLTGGGFELETELTLFSADKGFTIAEVPITYLDRPEGSESKLDTFQDGFRVVTLILRLLQYYRPMFFFGWASLCFLLSGLLAGGVPVVEYFQTAYVTRFPLAILASGLVLCALICFTVGLILDTIRHHERVSYELWLLRHKSTGRGRTSGDD